MCWERNFCVWDKSHKQNLQAHFLKFTFSDAVRDKSKKHARRRTRNKSESIGQSRKYKSSKIETESVNATRVSRARAFLLWFLHASLDSWRKAAQTYMAGEHPLGSETPSGASAKYYKHVLGELFSMQLPRHCVSGSPARPPATPVYVCDLMMAVCPFLLFFFK